jgi:glucose-1-phosphate cytidylyltransferase
MKCVILAGGMGTRLSEETETKPKPMVEIGGRPILWHIMKSYSAHGINDFIICLGYKGYLIKEYFQNYSLHMSDVTIDFRDNSVKVHQNSVEPWTVTLVDTGVDSMTGGRIGRVKKYVGDETFCLTYGDGVADLNITESIRFHKDHQKHATVTAVQPPGRFGSLSLDSSGTRIDSFYEKPRGDSGFINGGFFVLEPKIFDFIKGDETVWEQEPMKSLAQQQQLMAYKHGGFWYAMDTLRDKNHLEQLWDSGRAPWKVWS